MTNHDDIAGSYLAGIDSIDQLKFAIEYYGIDRVMYGSDYPCWDPSAALALIEGLGLSDADREKLLYHNAHRILALGNSARQGVPVGVVSGA